MGFWSRPLPAITHEYQQSIAHRVRDILTGADHETHALHPNNGSHNKLHLPSPLAAHKNKQALKALQRPEALAGVIEILKAMPEPCHRADGWEVDEGVDVDDSDEDVGYNSPGSPVVSGLAFQQAAGSSQQQPVAQPQQARPSGTTIVAATTIAAAAATSAVAATMAVTLGRKTKQSTSGSGVVGAGAVVSGAATGDLKGNTTTTTVVRFHPAKNEVSSHAYWWGYEIFIPQEALSRIGAAQDVSSAFLGFLGSVGLVVPAIVPFLGYIAAYVGLEFAVIKAQNEGKGVILASTWLVPVALVPRAWDVPEEEGVDDARGSA